MDMLSTASCIAPFRFEVLRFDSTERLRLVGLTVDELFDEAWRAFFIGKSVSSKNDKSNKSIESSAIATAKTKVYMEIGSQINQSVLAHTYLEIILIHTHI